MSSEPKWKILAQKARDIRDKSMAEVDQYFPANGSKYTDPLPDPLPLNVTGLPEKYLSPHEYHIIETDPMVLLHAIERRTYTALEVASAYMHASVLAQRAVNCVTEFLPKLAYDQAVYLDKYIQENGRTVGPLHGLPISLKDVLDLQGRANNFGTTALVENIREQDCALVEILRENGAVFYQRTTQPQFLLHLECDNNIYGYTVNPFNTSLATGGSSGGEGASAGFHSSCVGVGTDFAGSTRVPASFQGQFGLKPTIGRLPCDDCYNLLEGSEGVHFTVGVMGRTLDIVKYLTKVIIDSKPWIKRRELVATPWNKHPLENKRKITIGVLNSDGIAKPQPPVTRAIKEIADKLISSGTIRGIEIDVVPFEPCKHDQAMEIIMNLYHEQGGIPQRKLADSVGEPMMPLSDVFLNKDNPIGRECSVPDLWKYNAMKRQYRAEYNKYWLRSGIDVLICPVHPGPAQPHNSTTSFTYTTQWTVLDYPCIAFPVTVVDQEKDVPETNYKPCGEVDSLYYHRYRPEVYKGAPVGLQLVAQRNEDEKLLECMTLIDKALHRRPYTQRL